MEPELRFSQVDGIIPDDSITMQIRMDLFEEDLISQRLERFNLKQRGAVIDFGDPI